MIGNRLKLAREAKGWSLRDLEGAIERVVSAQAIGKYERNEMMPGSTALMAMAKALEVSIDYLLSERQITLEQIDFRQVSVSAVRDERALEAAVMDRVEGYLELEGLFPDAFIQWERPLAPEFRLNRVEDAEAAAKTLRHCWKLGIDPIDSMTELLESKGIKVIQLPLPPKVSGSKALACPAGGEPVAIIVVNEADNGERQRLTLAHELAHYVIDWEAPSDKDHERAANWFAGAFLVAREKIEAVLGRSRTAITLGELEAAKRVFKVSLAALAMRLNQLGIVTKATFGRVWAILVTKGYTKLGAREPFPVTAEIPERAKRLALRAVSERMITESRGAELLRLRLAEFEALLHPEMKLEAA